MTGSLVIATTLVVALVSCPRGGDAARMTKAQYEQKVQALYGEVQAAFRATRNASGVDLGAKIAVAQQALRHAAGELAVARPPREIEQHNRELVEGMREYAAALDAAIRAVTSGNDSLLASFQDTSGNTGVRKMSEAAEEMKYKGYNLGALDGER